MSQNGRGREVWRLHCGRHRHDSDIDAHDSDDLPALPRLAPGRMPQRLHLAGVG